MRGIVWCAFESCFSPHLQLGQGWSWARSPWRPTAQGPPPETDRMSYNYDTYLNSTIAKDFLEDRSGEEGENGE